MQISKLIAVAYTLFVVFAFLAGYLSNSGPLNYIFVYIASLPWAWLLSFVTARGTMLIPIIGIAINLTLL
jgi:hypothetical protein